MWLVHLSEDLWQQPQVLECSEMFWRKNSVKQVDDLKKNCIYRAQNLLGPRPIRPISGLRIQDSVQLLQEQLHDSMILHEPCFARTRANPHVYVCMFVRNIYIYIFNPLLYITYKFDKCMTTYDSTKTGCKSTSVVIAFGFNGSRVVGRSNAVFCACAKHFYTQNLLCWIGSDHQKLPIHTTPLPSNSRPLIYHHQLVPLSSWSALTTWRPFGWENQITNSQE